MIADERPVLVVEDDADLADLVQESLATVGIRSVVAHNGREALETMARTRPAVILLDLMMPVMDGWEFRRKQLERSDAASVPVIVMTADGRAQEKARELGAQGHLGKPASLEALVAELERVRRTARPEPARSAAPREHESERR